MKNGNINGELDKSSERIVGMFNRVAPRYDFLNHFLSAGIDRSWRRRAVRHLARRLARNLNAPILDVATGTGDLAIDLVRFLCDSEQADPKQVVGVDFCPEMLRLAERKVRKLRLEEKILLRPADALALPFADESFSAVTVAFGLRNMADVDAALAEMIRVCVPEGHVAVLEFSMPETPILSSLYKFYIHSVLPFIGRFFSKKSDSAYAYLPASVADFDRSGAVRARFERLGLSEVEVVSFTFGIAKLYLGQKRSKTEKFI